MDEPQRQQIALIHAHELDLANRDANREANAIYAANSFKGVLQSGATVRQVVRAIGTATEILLDKLLRATGSVTKGAGSFNMIQLAIDDHFANVQVEVDRAARMASGRSAQAAVPSVAKAANELFDGVKSDIRARLEIERFAFKSIAQDPAPIAHAHPLVTAPKNKGGKPLAAHWDQMWSSIAVRLWLGDLQPERLSHVKEAMLAWFADKEIEIGDTAITERARQLWQKMEDAQ